MILKGQEGSLTIRLYLQYENKHVLEHPPSLTVDGLNYRICDAGLPDSGMRNTLSFVCTRLYTSVWVGYYS